MTLINFLIGEYSYAFGMLAYFLIIGILSLPPVRNRFRNAFPLLIAGATLPMWLFILIVGSDNPSTLIWLAVLPTLTFMIFPFRPALIALSGILGIMVLMFIDPFRTFLQLRFHPFFPAEYILLFFLLFVLLSSTHEGLRNIEDTKLEASWLEILHLSYFDDLTGVFNRRSFDKALMELGRRPSAMSTTTSLLMIDIDDFKKYNDHFGHLQGDKILTTIALTINSLISRTEGMVFARFGGEEFVVLMPNSDGKAARELAELIKEAVSSLQLRYFEPLIPMPQTLTVSIGVASDILGRLDRPEELIRMADENLYRAKRNGKNAVWSDSQSTLNS